MPPGRYRIVSFGVVGPRDLADGALYPPRNAGTTIELAPPIDFEVEAGRVNAIGHVICEGYAARNAGLFGPIASDKPCQPTLRAGGAAGEALRHAIDAELARPISAAERALLQSWLAALP
jgi:hypothetical protein